MGGVSINRALTVVVEACVECRDACVTTTFVGGGVGRFLKKKIRMVVMHRFFFKNVYLWDLGFLQEEY